MKRIIVVLLSLVLLTGCGAKNVDNSYLKNYNNVSFYDNGTTTKEITIEPTTEPVTTTTKAVTTTVRTTTAAPKPSIIGPNTNDIVGEARNNVVLYKDKIDQMIASINRYRSQNGLNPVQYDYELSVAASVRAVEMSYTDIFEHYRQCQEGYTNESQCRKWSSVYQDLGIKYNYAAENIAHGFTDIERSMVAFMNSDSHRKNILSNKAIYVGIGVSKDGSTYYFVQLYKA